MEVKVVFCICVLLHCILLASSYSGKLLYSTYSLIKEFDVDTRNVTILLELGNSYVFAIDYDYKNRFVYFPRYNTFYDIVRFAYPSKNLTLQTVIQSLSYPTGIAVDSANDHLYWVEYVPGRLSRCNLNGSNMTVLSTVSYPWGIRLDVINRWMYIVERQLGILKSRFDLFEKQTIVNFTSISVPCMDIDPDEHIVYWINYSGEMKSANVDGSDVTTIISTNRLGSFYDAIGVFGGYIYYANDSQLLILDKTQGSTPAVLYNDTSRINSLFLFKQSGM